MVKKDKTEPNLSPLSKSQHTDSKGQNRSKKANHPKNTAKYETLQNSPSFLDEDNDYGSE